jgi:hypothetical protein
MSRIIDNRYFENIDLQRTTVNRRRDRQSREAGDTTSSVWPVAGGGGLENGCQMVRSTR